MLQSLIMNALIKYLLYALVLVLVIAWISTVVKSCNSRSDEGVSTEEASNPAYETMSDTGEEAALDDFLDEDLPAENDDELSLEPTDEIDYSRALTEEEEDLFERAKAEKAEEDGQ